jgi:hypothetical protein
MGETELIQIIRDVNARRRGAKRSGVVTVGRSRRFHEEGGEIYVPAAE